eukprot:1144353-Pelagomonas_calceolata.AAC.5
MYDKEVCVNWRCSEGLRWPDWEGRNPNFAEPLLPNFARCTPGQHILTALVTSFAWQAYRQPSFSVDGGLADSGQEQPANLLQAFLQHQPLPPTGP